MGKNRGGKRRENVVKCRWIYMVVNVPFCGLKNRPCKYVKVEFCNEIFEGKGGEKMAGRPIESSSGKKMDKWFKMRIDTSFDKGLDKLAKKLNCGRSEAVRTVILEYLKNHENC